MDRICYLLAVGQYHVYVYLDNVQLCLLSLVCIADVPDACAMNKCYSYK
jgi:hypothetical protein